MLAQLDEHELALGIEAEADQPGPEQRHRRLAQLGRRGRQRDWSSGYSSAMPVEERDRLGREQRDLLLLHEHRELGADSERAWM